MGAPVVNAKPTIIGGCETLDLIQRKSIRFSDLSHFAGANLPYWGYPQYCTIRSLILQCGITSKGNHGAAESPKAPRKELKLFCKTGKTE
jgi:hypothetical protein